MTLIRCGGLCCVSLVSHFLNDIPCKNYNYFFVFVKVMPKILLVPFFPDTVYSRIPQEEKEEEEEDSLNSFGAISI